MENISPSYEVSSTPHTRIHKDHPIDHVIGDVQSSVQTRRMTTSYSELGFLGAIYEGKTHQDLHTCLFACFLSQEEPKRVSKALSDPAWVEAMQEELQTGSNSKSLVLVDLPKRIIGIYQEGALLRVLRKLMKAKFQMISMGELTFFLGLGRLLWIPKPIARLGRIFEHMVSNISSPHKFLMYPRFIQICLDMQKHHLQQHSRIYPVPSLSMKVFSNMKRSTKGFLGQEVALFPNMLADTTPSTSPSRITSSPSPLPEPTPAHTTAAPTQPSPTQPSPTLPSPGAEHHFPTPNESPLHAVHSYGSDEGSLKLNELMNLVTKLSDRIGALEDDLKKTKKTYSSAYTKLILRVKKLESQIKTGKARRKARVVLSDDEVLEDDSSKQGRKLSDAEVQEKASTETELFIQEVTPTEVIQTQEGSEKGSDEVSTAGAKQGTASEEVPIVSTAEVNLSTAGGTVT
ncbi:hypothetical protein Tco_0885820, partial [Tanacetum coccineum]